MPFAILRLAHFEAAPGYRILRVRSSRGTEEVTIWNRIYVPGLFCRTFWNILVSGSLAPISFVDIRLLAGCMGLTATERCLQRSELVDAWDL